MLRAHAVPTPCPCCAHHLGANFSYDDLVTFGVFCWAQGDNGRVPGFDNAHGHHHRHYMGAMEPVQFTSYEETLERFQQEWQQIVKQAQGRKP